MSIQAWIVSLLASAGLSVAVGNKQEGPTCILDADNVEAIVATFLEDDDSGAESAADFLERHATLHRWSDVSVLNAAPRECGYAICDAALLDRLKAVAGRPFGESEYRLANLLADLFERNGRADQAIILLKGLAVVEGESFSPFASTTMAAWTDERIGYIAFRQRDWKLALEAWKNWGPSGGCGNCMGWQSERMARLRARCLLELGDLTSLRALVESETQESFFGSPPCFAELLVEGLYRADKQEDVPAALAEVAKGASERNKPLILRAHEHYKILQLPPLELLPRALELLEGRHHEDVEDALAALGDEGYATAMRMLATAAPDWGSEHLSLMRIIARSGRPDAGEFITGIMTQIEDKLVLEQLKRVYEEWSD